MHPSSISVTSVGATLALVMLLLVWQPMSLQNTIRVHIIPCWWSHSSCNAFQMHSMIFKTVRWLISLHIAWSSDPQFCVTHRARVPLVIRCNSDRVDQIVVPKSGGFHELLIEELHVTPLAGHLGV